MLLPVALDVHGRLCLVVGGGPVGARKLHSLLDCGAQATLISPVLSEEAEALVPACKYLQREWRSGDCRGFSLVWACTPSREVNEAIAREAREAGVWCGVSGPGEGGGLHGASAVRRGSVCVGITTGGASPALARHLKQRVEAAVGPEYEVLLGWMGEARAGLKARLPEQGERARLWRALLSSDVLDLLRLGDEAKARARFDEVVGQ